MMCRCGMTYEVKSPDTRSGLLLSSMKIARIQILVGFFLTVAIVVTVRVMVTQQTPQALTNAETSLQLKRYALKERTLERNDTLIISAIGGAIASCCLSALIVAAGLHRERVRRASVYMLEIGEHTKVPIHISQIKNNQLARERMTLAAAEELRQLNAGRDKAIDALERILAANAKQPRIQLAPADAPMLASTITPDVPPVPTFSQMLQHGAFFEGADLVFGFDASGAPQPRKLEDVIALTVAGWQKSGKTRSTGYLVASVLLTAPGSEAYVIDPHAGHPDGLGALLKPLEVTGRLKIVNPAEAAGLIRALDALLDQRLAGDAPSVPIVVLVIDEMNRIGKTEFFQSTLLPFLERCTEEVRKAGIMFIGAGQKWQAKFFGNRADIRQSMPSVLAHKMKPSQAELLFEDTKEKMLVKHLTRPGQALLCTSHDADPMPVQMPLMTKQDVEYISQHVVKQQVNGPLVDYTIDLPVDSDKSEQGGNLDLVQKLDRHCQQRGNFSRMVKDLHIDQGYLSRIRAGKQPASPEWEHKILSYLEKPTFTVLPGGKT